VLRELGVDVLPVLVSAGVLCLAIGFGAQALIRDHHHRLLPCSSRG
jgi:small conductance mechanosensitive channel